MKKILSISLAVLSFFPSLIFAQIPTNILVQISRAEDELRFDKTLEDLMRDKNANIRARAALAAGRIGKEAAIPTLAELLERDADLKVRSAAAFALGEIESVKGADAILTVLQNTKNDSKLRARAVEAAGKIAAANAKDAKGAELGKAVLDTLQFENNRGAQANRSVVLLGITAILRAKPEGGDAMAAKFLTAGDGRIRADAANTLSRLRAKNATNLLRAMLLSDKDPIARANAARALGAAEDKDAFDILLKSAVTDTDSRVRVSAIRSLGSLKDAKAADKLLERAENLLANYKKSRLRYSIEKNELLEIAATLSKILPDSDNERALKILETFCQLHTYCTPEIEISLAKISPKKYVEKYNVLFDTKMFSASKGLMLFAKDDKMLPVSGVPQGLGELANNSNPEIKLKAEKFLRFMLEKFYINEIEIPDVLRAFAQFKAADLNVLLQQILQHKDLFIRATAAELLGEQSANKENVEALKTAFTKSLETDKRYNDAQLAILSALVKSDKKEAIDSLKLALDAPNFLVRRRAAQLVKQNDLQTSFPNANEKVGTVKHYNPKTGTKLGQILNTNADYVRAVSRKTARAVLKTEKGSFTIEFSPEAAPLTVDNFIKLARAKYFGGLAIHRVVPNFVMQDGDPRGDGNGSPGWEIRDEINDVPFERGTVGMALSGKDTGGSQWFVCHSPQPHLDGGYTVFGRVSETDMKVVDNLVRGDKILSVKIVEGNSPQKNAKVRKGK